MDLLALPFELLVAIIAYLDPKDILAFCLVCHYAQDVYRRSFNLQYRVALFASGKEDAHLPNPMSRRDRLAYTLRREAMWRILELDRGRLIEIAINHRHSHVHDLTSGLYIFGDLSLVPDNLKTESLRYVRLPTCTHLRPSAEGPDHGVDWWTTKPIGVEALCIGLSLEDNDLLAALTSVSLMCAFPFFWEHEHYSKLTTRDSDEHAFKLHLQRFSATGYHHLAREPVIQFHQHRNLATHCIATIEIAGPYLLILLTWLRAPNTSDELYIFDWMKGFLILVGCRSLPSNAKADLKTFNDLFL